MNPTPPALSRQLNLWHATDKLCLRSWGDEFVAYHRLSGDTHLLGTAAGYLLRVLQSAPTDPLSLCQTLAVLLNVEPNNEFKLQTDDLLAELDGLALIERA